MFRQYVTMDLYLCAGVFPREIGYNEETIRKHISDINAISAAMTSVQQSKVCITEIIENTIVARDYKATKRYRKLI